MIGGTAIGRGQRLHYPTEGVPRHADSTANLSAPPPRLPDGKPDFSGIWHVALRNPCNERTSFIPCNSEIGGSPLALDIGVQLPGGLPYQPWAAALVKEREANVDVGDAQPFAMLGHIRKLTHQCFVQRSHFFILGERFSVFSRQGQRAASLAVGGA